MRKLILRTIIIAAVMLTGCNGNIQTVTQTSTSEISTATPASSPTATPTETPTSSLVEKVNNIEVECAESFTTHVSEKIFYNNEKFEKSTYDITQGKGGMKYSAELIFDSDKYTNSFTLKNENGETLLTLSHNASGYVENKAVEFLDVNRDGYVDIKILEEEGTLNDCYALYTWDDSAKNFVKVKFDGMLSYFEVHDGCLRNWLKESADEMLVQELVWEGNNTLVVKSAESALEQDDYLNMKIFVNLGEEEYYDVLELKSNDITYSCYSYDGVKPELTQKCIAFDEMLSEQDGIRKYKLFMCLDDGLNEIRLEMSEEFVEQLENNPDFRAKLGEALNKPFSKKLSNNIIDSADI